MRRATTTMKVFSLLALCATACMTREATAQQGAGKYPEKSLRLILPFAPGGGTDLLARTLAQRLTETFGHSVVVDNRSGGGGTIGHEIAVRAAPDGYTLALTSGSYATNAALFKLPYDPIADITAIALLGETAWMLSVHPGVPAKSTGELIALMKAKPNSLNFASTGTGGVTHMVTELFNLMAGTRMTHVPYKGTGAALNDLIGGQVQLIFGGMAPMIAMHRTGRLRAIAVTTAKRINAVPDIPTIGETVTDYEATLWYGCFGPRHLPRDVTARLNTEIDRAMSNPAMRERLASEGIDPVGGVPERLLTVIKRDLLKWRQVVRQARIQSVQ